MITYEQFQELQERLNMLEAIHGVFKKEIEKDIEALDHVLSETDPTHSEFYDEWVRGCRTGMAIGLDIVTAIVQGVLVGSDVPALPMHPPRPIRIRYFEAVTDTERHVRDGSVIEPEDYRPETEEDEESQTT